MNLPSGDTVGLIEGLEVSSTGLPPSIDTFHNVGFAVPSDENSTHWPSGDIVGSHSPCPLLNCFGLLPSMFMRQIAPAPVRVEVNTIYRPSADTTGPMFFPELEVSCLR